LKRLRGGNFTTESTEGEREGRGQECPGNRRWKLEVRRAEGLARWRGMSWICKFFMNKELRKRRGQECPSYRVGGNY